MVNINDEMKKALELGFYLYDKEIQRVIAEGITDEAYIRSLLDYLLDSCYDNGILFLYRTLIRYYLNINKEDANLYIEKFNSKYGDKDLMYFTNDKHIS